MRTCGECSLCCKLVPVRELRKPANHRCQHQRRTGCAIYERRPMSCAVWTCRWLAGDDTAELRRPDRSHYVIDLVPDFVELEQEGHRLKVPVVQVWLDPDYPDAWRDPALLAWLERRAAEGKACLVRTSSHEAFSVFAPALSNDGQWHEVRHGKVEPQHSAHEIIRAQGER
jgi:hypothetical protein